jgi:NAD dependent epimerase/dehydratase family enzyme
MLGRILWTQVCGIWEKEIHRNRQNACKVVVFRIQNYQTLI